MRRLICVAALLPLFLTPFAAASVAQSPAGQWLAIPDLSPATINRLASEFELRGTYGDLTLAVADESALEELRRLQPGAVSAGDYRADERVFVVHLAPEERLNLTDGARLLLERDGLAIVGLADASMKVDSVLEENRLGLFHEGIALVSDRRQRPQPAAPTAAAAFVHDPEIQAWVDSVSMGDLEADVTSLSTLFTSRRSDTSGGDAAQQWLVDRFETLGLATSTHSFDGDADNVIAEIPGTLEPESVVIVGAHYDSIAFSGSVAPGADDNASGTSALLEIARILSTEGASFRYTVRLIAFASEEFGLVGSNAYSQMLVNQGVNVVAMLNTDMNAYRKSGDALDLDMVTNSTTSWLTDDLIEISNLYVPELPTRKGQLGAGSSDHASFFNDGFPAAFYFEDTGDYSPFIHSSGDVVGTSANDFELSRRIVQAVLAGTAVLAEPTGGQTADQLSLAGTCPGDLTVQVTDVTPNGSVFIVRSANEGTFSLPSGTCRDTVFGLDKPKVLGSASADSNGTAVLVKRFPNAGCGLFLQAMDKDTCVVTNVIQVP